jgi:hypothetical protein
VFTLPDRARDDDFRSAQRQFGAFCSPEQNGNVFRSQKEACSRLIDHGVMDFWFWGKFSWDVLWSSVFAIASQSWVDKVCIGVTLGARWRWADCDGHNNMAPHREHYDIMYPLSCSFGRSAASMEQLLQVKLRNFLPGVCVHTQYRRGVVRENSRAYVVYLCVKNR